MSSGLSRAEAMRMWLAFDYVNLPKLKPSDWTLTSRRAMSERIVKAFDIKQPHPSRPLDADLAVAAQMVKQTDWHDDRCQMHKYGIFCNHPGTPFKAANDDRFCTGHALKIKLQMHALQRDLEAQTRAQKQKAAIECPHEPRVDNFAVCRHCQMTMKEIREFGGAYQPIVKEAEEFLPEHEGGKVLAFPSSGKEINHATRP